MRLEYSNLICPKCGNGNYMRHLVGKDVGELNVKCINCNSYFKSSEVYNMNNNMKENGTVTLKIKDCESQLCYSCVICGNDIPITDVSETKDICPECARRLKRLLYGTTIAS